LHSVYSLDSNIVFAGGLNLNSNRNIVKSVDGGLSWQTTYVENYIWTVDILKIGMVNDTTGYALTRGYVLKTTDGGMNWNITDTASVRSGAMFSILEDLALFPDNDTVYTCGWYSPYFGTTVNGGNVWQHQDDFNSYNLDFINTQTGYIAGWSQIHKTTDGGMTFVDASGGNPNLFSEIYSLDFTDEWTGYACGSNGRIIKTINGGTTGFAESPATAKSILIFPNPSSDRIQFSEKTDVRISNSMGMILSEYKNTNTIDISELPSGVYILTFTDNIGTTVRQTKIIRSEN
jgi:photosystem II stability/assembly factor-like uncharacterized protein